MKVPCLARFTTITICNPKDTSFLPATCPTAIEAVNTDVKSTCRQTDLLTSNSVSIQLVLWGTGAKADPFPFPMTTQTSMLPALWPQSWCTRLATLVAMLAIPDTAQPRQQGHGAWQYPWATAMSDSPVSGFLWPWQTLSWLSIYASCWFRAALNCLRE